MQHLTWPLIHLSILPVTAKFQGWQRGLHMTAPGAALIGVCGEACSVTLKGKSKHGKRLAERRDCRESGASPHLEQLILGWKDWLPMKG